MLQLVNDDIISRKKHYSKLMLQYDGKSRNESQNIKVNQRV
jgi:hypothetical protein